VPGDVLIGSAPVLVAPRTGVSGVDRPQADAVLVGLGGESPAKDARGDPGHGLAEPPPSLASAHDLTAGGPGVGEVEVLDRDGSDAVAATVADEPGDGVPDLGIAAGGAAGQAELDPLGIADRIAVRVKSADGEVPVVEVHPYNRPVGAYFGVRRLRAGTRCLGWCGPGGGQVDPGTSGLAVDGVGDGLAAGDSGQPFVPSIGEPGLSRQDVPAALGVGQVLQWLG